MSLFPTENEGLPVLRRGASGDLVRRWQSTIGVAPADGSFGPATEVATKDWQAAHSLSPDGVVGARSWAVALAELPAGASGPAPAPATPAGPGVAPLEGIDVSSIQGVIDWPRVKAAGISFAYVRALLGRDDQDRRLTQNCAGALAEGIEVGVYGVLYPRHGRAQDADEQARQLAALHRTHKCTLRPMIDFETVKTEATPQEWLAALDAYCDALDIAGLPAILYT